MRERRGSGVGDVGSPSAEMGCRWKNVLDEGLSCTAPCVEPHVGQSGEERERRCRAQHSAAAPSAVASTGGPAGATSRDGEGRAPVTASREVKRTGRWCEDEVLEPPTHRSGMSARPRTHEQGWIHGGSVDTVRRCTSRLSMGRPRAELSRTDLCVANLPLTSVVRSL